MEFWLVVLVWLLWIATAVQCGFAVNGFLVERREGMRISAARLCVVGGIFTIATLLVFFATLMPFEPVPVSTETPQVAVSALPPDQAKKIRDQLAQVQAEEDQLIARRRALEGQLHPPIPGKPGQPAAALKPGLIHSLKGIDPRTRSTFVIGALAGLSLIGLIVLALGGQLQSLLPNGWQNWGDRGGDGDESVRDLDRLAGLATAEKYRDGLELAEKIAEKKLRPFDRLDYLFLYSYCAVQVAADSKIHESADQREQLLTKAIQMLEMVTDEAPKRADAVYTLASAYARKGQFADALNAFQRSRELIQDTSGLSFDHNESVCLLRLAENALSDGNIEQAESYYVRVTGEKLGGSVVQSRLRIGMVDLRSAMNKQDLATASATLGRLRSLPGLSNEQHAQVDVIASALNARIALRSDDPNRALVECENFLTRHLPADLPPIGPDTANDPFSPVLDPDLVYPREIFLGFLFIEAVALSRLETKRRSKLSEAQVDKIAEPLFRALQFVPRQRDLLGAVGGLYYWFRPEHRALARDWLEAAATMGSRGRIVRAILERDRLIEMERREALDWFRSASSRFLRDPSLSGEVRRALVEELGRFQEFETMLINLEQRPEPEQTEPTIQGIRDRTSYLADLLANIAGRSPSERFIRLQQIHTEYSACLSTLEQNMQTISSLERRVFAEMAAALILN